MKIHQHFIFWISAAVVLTIGFGLSYSEFAKAFYFVSFLMPVAIGTGYFFNYVLVPRFLLQEKYVRFVLYSIYMIFVSLYLEMLVVTLSFVLLANYNYHELSPLMTNIFALGVIVYFFVILQSAFLLFKQLRNHKSELANLKAENEKNKKEVVTIRANRTNYSIELSKVMYVESLSDYVKIHLMDSEPIMTKETISSFEQQLPSNFIRIHRSFIINRDFLLEFNSLIVILNTGLELPIGRTYKKDVMSQIG